MEEPWTLVVVAMCACLVVCVLLFTIFRCCLCSYKGMKDHKMDTARYIIPFDYRPNVVMTVDDASATEKTNDNSIAIHLSSPSSSVKVKTQPAPGV
ncbi:hypothetical protein GHT06_020068 [Daphnia sinensis]|uniref:Uncharacterized protein n=1 Tax=Daphnia sinensis TaxID=1820382 RepID=A0AAD5PP61_9CRUS|nr:hypothetical protein GHT06_020068 [Daphnia sinensis]